MTYFAQRFKELKKKLTGTFTFPALIRKLNSDD